MTTMVFFSSSGEVIDFNQHNVMAIGYIDQDPSLFDGVGVYFMHRSYELGALSKLLELDEVTLQTRVYCTETYRRLGSVGELREVNSVLNNVVLQLVAHKRYRFETASQAINKGAVIPFEFVNGNQGVERLLEVYGESNELVWSYKKGWVAEQYGKIVRYYLALVDAQLANDVLSHLIDRCRLQGLGSIQAGNEVLRAHNLGYKIHTVNHELMDVDASESQMPIYRACFQPNISEGELFHAYAAGSVCDNVAWKGDLVTSLYSRYHNPKQ